MSLVEKLFGSFSDRELKKVNPITKQVLALELSLPFYVLDRSSVSSESSDSDRIIPQKPPSC